MNTTVIAGGWAKVWGRVSRRRARAASGELVFRRSELRFVWAFWAFVAMLTFANSLMNDAMSSGVPHLPAAAPFVTAVVNGLIWAALTLIMFRLTSRYSLDRPSWVLPLVLFLAAGVAISIGVAELMSVLRYVQALYYSRTAATPMAGTLVDPVKVVHQFWFMKEYSIYLVVLCGAYAHDYFVRYRIRHQQASALEAQAAHFRAELADARLGALRSQLNPHFLFNTLNTVSSLVERDPRGARRMLAQLSDLLRDTLGDGEREVTLEAELRTARRYVDIMCVRFGGQLRYVEDVSPEALHAMVPTLLLQPLVENAIKHGVERRGGSDTVEIAVRPEGGALRIRVLNGGGHDEEEPQPSCGDRAGLGLANTRKRLEHSYGDCQSLLLRRQDGKTVVEINLPFHTRPLVAQPQHV